MSKLKFLTINKMIWILLISTLCIFIGCSVDRDQSSLEDVLRLRSNNKVIKVSYDMEMITYFKAEDDIETDQDVIASTPFIEAQSVDFSIDEFGEIYLELIRLEPSERIELIEKPLANPRPLWHRIVYASGNLSTYDDENDKIHEFAISMPNEMDLIDSLISQAGGPIEAVINESSGCPNLTGTNLSFDDFIDYADRVGASIVNQGNGLVTIRLSASLTSITSDPTDIIVLLLDRVNELLIGYTLYDATEEFRGSMLFLYDDEDPHFLRGSQLVTIITLPSGLSAKQIMDISFSNFEVAINIE